MKSAVADKHVLEKMCHQKESATERLQRDLNELKKRVQQYHAHLDHVEQMCEETKVNFKNFQSKAELQCKIVKQDAAREAKFISQLTEMNAELEKTEGEK